MTIDGVSVKVTQIAFPESVNNSVHTTGVYASRGTNPTSNTSDNIFADSLSSELVTPVGDPTDGFTASLQVGVASPSDQNNTEHQKTATEAHRIAQEDTAEERLRLG